MEGAQVSCVPGHWLSWLRFSMSMLMLGFLGHLFSHALHLSFAIQWYTLWNPDKAVQLIINKFNSHSDKIDFVKSKQPWSAASHLIYFLFHSRNFSPAIYFTYMVTWELFYRLSLFELLTIYVLGHQDFLLDTFVFMREFLVL